MSSGINYLLFELHLPISDTAIKEPLKGYGFHIRRDFSSYRIQGHIHKNIQRKFLIVGTLTYSSKIGCDAPPPRR